MILDENIGLAKVSKEDQGRVNQTYASAIRDIEKAKKKRDEFTKRQEAPKHNEKPKNPKMAPGAKRMHLDKHLFESDLYEKKRKTKEQILDDLYDELRRAKYLVNADPVGYRIGKKQPKGQVQLSRKDKSYEFIKDEKDLDDAKAIVDKYGFKYYVKSTLGVPSLYIDTESLDEEIYSAPNAAGGEMSFDIKGDGTIIIYDGDKIIKQSKTNPTYAKQVLKDLGFIEKKSMKEDYNSNHEDLEKFIIRLNNYADDIAKLYNIRGAVDTFDIESLAHGEPGVAGFEEDESELKGLVGQTREKDREIARLLRELNYLRNNYNDFREIAREIIEGSELKEKKTIKESFEDEHLGSTEKVIEDGNEIIPNSVEPGPGAGLATQLNELIRDEWEAIQGYNDAIVMAELEGFHDVAKVFKDIVNEENVHVGQLEQCMKLVSPNTDSINQGETEATGQLTESKSLNEST